MRESARGWNSALPVRNPGTTTAALMGGSSDVEGDGVLNAPITLHLMEIMVRIDASQRQRDSPWRGMAMLGGILQSYCNTRTRNRGQMQE